MPRQMSGVVGTARCTTGQFDGTGSAWAAPYRTEDHHRVAGGCVVRLRKPETLLAFAFGFPFLGRKVNYEHNLPPLPAPPEVCIGAE